MLKWLTRLLAGLCLTIITTTTFASPQNPQVNVDYQMLAVPQDANVGKKIEVIEFFG